MLELNTIDVFYGDVQALWEVSLTVNKGEIVALVGSNGAGKTTTLRTISGLLRPASGNIKLHGQRVDNLPAHRVLELGIAHVPEGRRLWPDMSVKDNIELGAFTREARKKRLQSLEWIYQLFPRVKERANQLAGTLSGGEQQMVAISRGLMSLPKLLMLDEPSLGLAPILVKEVFRTIRQINDEGVTVLLVEQNVHLVLEFAHRGYVLETGRCVLEGKASDLISNPEIQQAYLGL